MMAKSVARFTATALLLLLTGLFSSAMAQSSSTSSMSGLKLSGDKPIQIVPLGAKDSDIVNMAALAAFNIGG